MFKPNLYQKSSKYDNNGSKKHIYKFVNSSFENSVLNTSQMSLTRKKNTWGDNPIFSYGRTGPQKYTNTTSKKPTQQYDSNIDKCRRQSTSKQNKSSLQKRTVNHNSGNYRRAPSNQFKKYLDDSENVFWENSWQGLMLSLCKSSRIYLMIFFIFLAISYIGIGGIKPWPKDECPQHADCGVFIHCKKGYIEENEHCFLDPAIKVKAKSIALATIQQLKFDYGALDCETQFKKVPTARTLQIFQEFRVVDQQLKNQIYIFLEDKENRVNHHFNYQQFTVTPTEKYHPFTCQLQLFSKTDNFYWLLGGLLVSFLVVGKLINRMLFKNRALEAYNYLKQQCQKCENILIEFHKIPIRKLVGQWNDQLWQEIDRLRFEQRLIVYFELNHQLYWKFFKIHNQLQNL